MQVWSVCINGNEVINDKVFSFFEIDSVWDTEQDANERAGKLRRELINAWVQESDLQLSGDMK